MGFAVLPQTRLESKKRPSYGGLAIKLLFVLAVFVLARKAPVMSSRKQHGAASNSLPSSVRLQQQLQISRQSFCGNTSWADVEQLIPEGWQYFRNRWEHNKEDWALALTWAQQQDSSLRATMCDGHQQRLRVLLYFGAFHHMGMTGLNGTPQGEQLQWHDLYVALLLLGYNPVLVDKPMALTDDYLDASDVIITDYIGVHYAMRSTALSKHRCKLRLLDSWGTDAGPNMRSGSGYCCLKLPSLSQFWTFTPGYSPENSFLGYTVRSFRPLQEFEATGSGGGPKRNLQVLLYGKEFQFLKNDIPYIQQLTEFAPTHATAMGWPDGTLPAVQNHGVLSPQRLHEVMQETFAYAGFAAVMMGPAAMEAVSQGMVFLNYAFVPPRDLSKTQGKPTTQLWTSQFPFLEQQQPHVLTFDTNDRMNVTAQLAALNATYNEWWVQDNYSRVQPDAVMGDYVFLGKTRGHRSGYVPYEYTTVAMMLRVDKLMRSNVCRFEGHQSSVISDVR